MTIFGKNFSTRQIIIFIVVIAAVVGGYMLYINNKKKKFVSEILRTIGWLKEANAKMTTIESNSSGETQKESAKKWLEENGGEDWVKNIRNKAKDKGITFEAQLPIDVRWALAQKYGLTDNQMQKWYPVNGQ